MANRSDERLGTDKMLPLVLKMALPAVAAQLVNLLYGIVDRVYIGHIEGVGKDALAGVGITTAVIMLIAAFAHLVGSGGSPLAAIALGRGNREEASSILHNGLLMLLFFAFLCTLFPYTVMEPMLRLAGASAATLPYAKSYLSIYLIGTVFVMISTGLNMFISAQGRSGVAMLSVVIGAVLNTLLDPLFIFAFDMGVAGAAVATVISQLFSAAFVLGFLFSRGAVLRLSFSEMKPSLATIGKISALGISPFVMASTESLVGFTLNGQLSSFGGDLHVSAMTVMQSAMQMVSIPLAGFTQGIVPVLSYNYGHGRNDRVKQCFYISLGIVFGFNLVGMLAMVIFPEAVAAMFTDDSALIALVGQYMPLFLAGMTIFGLQRTCQNAFVSLGQAKISLVIALLRKVILLVPLALILPEFIGVGGVYLAEAVSDATAAIICTTIFAFLFPRILKRNPSLNIKAE